MKKLSILLLVIFILALPLTASAKQHRDRDRDDSPRYHQKWQHQAYHDKHWERIHYDSVPFKWHERHEYFAARYQLHRIYDNDWNDRFPGLRAYRWHDDNGFHYGHYRVRDAVFFYNDDDELVSIGFIHNGAFIFIRDDHSSYRNNDSFFLAWWNR